MDKADDRLKGNIGAAWLNSDGSIAIKLNAFVVLDTTKHDLTLRLFPNDRKGKSSSKKPTPSYEPMEDTVDDTTEDDQIPF